MGDIFVSTVRRVEMSWKKELPLHIDDAWFWTCFFVRVDLSINQSIDRLMLYFSTCVRHKGTLVSPLQHDTHTHTHTQRQIMFNLYVVFRKSEKRFKCTRTCEHTRLHKHTCTHVHKLAHTLTKNRVFSYVLWLMGVVTFNMFFVVDGSVVCTAQIFFNMAVTMSNAGLLQTGCRVVVF